MTGECELTEIIKRDRSENERKRFEGTFLDYLLLVKEEPEIAMLAHQRLFKIISEAGIEILDSDKDLRIRRLYGNKTIKKYKFFEEFYGIDSSVMKIARYFNSAAMEGEEARQVLYLVGPVGSGKSSIMEALKKGLENSPLIYALKDCPMREEPLHLVPMRLRKKFGDLLGVKIEGELCPICRYRLNHEYHGEYEKFPVVQVGFSVRARRGIGVVPPVDPNNQDTSVLVGGVDISQIDRYPEDDPRALSLNGAFHAGNRGIVEFIEIFKNETEYLHTIITATQEKCIPSPGKGAMIYFDGVILAHSNEAEWNKFKSDHTNEAILDRIVKIEVPYCLELNEEIKIYEKLLKKSRYNAHIAPHTIEMASIFAILTRLEPSPKVSLMTKLRIYNGEEIVDNGTAQKFDISQLRGEAPREGMTGISTRFIMKAIDQTLSESENNCINPITVMDNIEKEIKGLSISEEEKTRYLGFIQELVRKEYNKVLEKEISKAFIAGFSEQAESLFNNYLDHAEAYVNMNSLKDKNTCEKMEPDERFMRSIEEQIGISEAAVRGFRTDVTAYMFFVLRNGGKLDYKSYEPLREAIEKKLTASVRDISRIVTREKVRNVEQHKKYSAMVQEMKRNGYCEHCCNAVLSYAANNLWKD